MVHCTLCIHRLMCLQFKRVGCQFIDGSQLKGEMRKIATQPLWLRHEKLLLYFPLSSIKVSCHVSVSAFYATPRKGLQFPRFNLQLVCGTALFSAQWQAP